ncbi:MAG: autoinducer binding domain-containing protein, partial [Rhodospirillales bacterium]
MSKAGPHDPAFLERLMRLQRTGGRGAVGLVLGDFAASCGFNHFAYHVVRRPAPAPAPDDLHTYPGRWIRHYDQQGYARLDAPLVLAGREVLAFRWETAIARSGITPVQQRIFEEARDFGVGDGVTLPCHGPGGGLAVISFARPVLSARESFAEGR